jgi:hypothetical protein
VPFELNPADWWPKHLTIQMEKLANLMGVAEQTFSNGMLNQQSGFPDQWTIAVFANVRKPKLLCEQRFLEN